MASSQKEIIIESVEEVSVLVYSHYAVLAFLLYDTALLFDDEVKYFLKPPKKFISYLYFATRYNGTLVTILYLIWNSKNATMQECDGATYLGNILVALLILCIDYILLLRVRALYSKERTIDIVLAIAFSIEGISLLAFNIQGTVEDKPEIVPLTPDLTYCGSTSSGIAQHVISWCIPLVYGSLLMALAVYKSAKILKEEPGLNVVNIVKIIVRDQVAYFMALILISAGYIAVGFLSLNLPISVIYASVGNPAVLSSVGARLLINMKEAGAKGLNEGMGSNVSRATASGIDFAEHPAQTSMISGGADAGGTDEETEMEEV